MTKNRMIIFTRYPEPGKTKTRLIPALGAEGAAELYRRMTEHTVNVVRTLAKARAFSAEIRYDASSEQLMNEWLGNGFLYRKQTSADLGDRMWEAIRDAFDEGCERVLVFGCDCPGMRADILDKGLEQLAEHDLVLGPANDGGYYLIGLKRAYPELFSNVVWGSARVLEQTLAIASGLALSVALVDALDDIDRPEDLIKLSMESMDL